MTDPHELLAEIRDMVTANKCGPGADRRVGPFHLAGINCSDRIMVHVTARREGGDLGISLFPDQLGGPELEEAVRRCAEWERSAAP